MTNQEFVEAMIDKLDGIKELFEKKNKQYGTNDPFANFTSAAEFLYSKSDMEHKYEALRAAVSKHLANYKNHRIDGDKINESLLDIAVYMLIASVMVDEYNRGEE